MRTGKFNELWRNFFINGSFWPEPTSVNPGTKFQPIIRVGHLPRAVLIQDWWTLLIRYELNPDLCGSLGNPWLNNDHKTIIILSEMNGFRFLTSRKRYQTDNFQKAWSGWYQFKPTNSSLKWPGVLILTFTFWYCSKVKNTGDQPNIGKSYQNIFLNKNGFVKNN